MQRWWRRLTGHAVRVVHPRIAPALCGKALLEVRARGEPGVEGGRLVRPHTLPRYPLESIAHPERPRLAIRFTEGQAAGGIDHLPDGVVERAVVDAHTESVKGVCPLAGGTDALELLICGTEHTGRTGAGEGA